MSLSEIQQAVENLPTDERVRLTAWLVSRYPVLSVERLMTSAANLVDRGQWTPTAPTDDNRPQGKALERALRVAEDLGLDK